jgi:5-methylcytosine-specific restriction endonuclease McrA
VGLSLPPGVTRGEWEQARAGVLATAATCAICGRPLVPDAPPRSPWSTSVDHIISRQSARRLDLETQRFLALDPSNLQPVHSRCNSLKGRRARARRPRLVTSQRW